MPGSTGPPPTLSAGCPGPGMTAWMNRCSSFSSPRPLQRHARRRAAQEGGGKGVAVPAQIRGKPAQNLKPRSAVGPLDPRHRHFADPPAKPVRLHQELDAVAETLAGLDRNALDCPA